MKLISSREAVDFLSHAGPRPWVQRLLRWMAFDEGLAAYSRKGIVRSTCSVADMIGHLIEKAGQLSGPQMDAAIREDFSEEIAEKLVGKDPFSRFEGEPVTWGETDDPMQLDIGFFLYEPEIDWDAGTLTAEQLPGDGELNEVFFANSELLVSDLERPEYSAVLEGLSFEFSKIEMLLPSMTLGQTTGFTAAPHDRKKPVGRPPKWDWEGAMAFVISKAQHPDGLPTGSGAQARIETFIAEWFMQTTGEAPSPSQVRQRAAKIIQMIETPK